MIALRPYQQQSVEDLRAAMRVHRRVLFQSPTASGKSVMIAYMIGESARKGMSSWLVCHRKELLSQLSDTLWEAGVPHGRLAAGEPETADPVQVATIQTLVRRLDRLPSPDVLAYDEVHHIVSPTGMRLVEHCNGSWLIGLTATPTRLDGRGLGDVFTALVLGPSVADLISEGYLSPYRIFAPDHAIDTSGIHSRGGDWAKDELEVLVDQTSIIGDAVAHYQRCVAPGTCLVYCVSRLHARHVTAVYRDAGINAVYVAGDTPKGEREQAIEGFRTGQPPVIVSVDLFGEGLDVPGLNAVQLLRPTQSLGLFIQQIGRGLRVEPGKKALVILDHVGGCWRHGLPDDAREWTLEGRQRRRGKAEPAGPALRHCDACFCIYRATLSECPLCGNPYVPKGRSPEEIEGELKEIEAEEHRRYRKSQQGRARTLEELVEVARDQGKKPGWAGAVWASRQGITRGSNAFYAEIANARRIDRELADA